MQLAWWDVADYRGFLYGQLYFFELEIIWTKLDGNTQSVTLREAATWYELTTPEFEVSMTPESVLLTTGDITTFVIELDAVSEMNR